MTLPASWIVVRLADVCNINPPLTDHERPSLDSSVTFVPMSSVDELSGTISAPELRSYAEVAKGYTFFQEGDVLFAKITPCMENGKAAIARKLENGIGFGSTEFHVLRPGPELLADYLFYFVRQAWFRQQAAYSFVGSAGQQRVPAEFLERAKIPLPTLREQQRITTLLRYVETLKSTKQKFSNQLSNLKRNNFVEMFGDPDPRKNKRWPSVRLGDYVDVQTGGTPPRENPEHFSGTVNWVKSTELTDTNIFRTEEHINEAALSSSNAKVFPPNTILVAMYGQGQTRGRTAKLTIPAACNQACAALLPSDQFEPDFLPDICTEVGLV